MFKDPIQRRVSIDVELTRPKSPKEQLPMVTVVGIVPMDAPKFSEVAPQTLIRRSPNLGEGQMYVEHVRLSSPVQQVLLPSIRAKIPSKLRGSLISILSSGSREVDFILARGPDLLPWDLQEPAVVEMVASFLHGCHGSVVVLPDAGGPWPRKFSQTTDEFERLSRLHGTVHMYSPHFVENYQLGFMDAIVPTNLRDAENYIKTFRGSDVCLCSWTGDQQTLLEHGWKSAAAHVSGYMGGKSSYITQSLIGHKVPLGFPRKKNHNRSRLLGAPKKLQNHPVLEQNCILVELEEKKNYGRILSELTFRSPMYEWSIPAVRTVKSIHLAIRRAADPFVFAPVRETEAMILKAAMENVLEPFFSAGVLMGPDGKGPPQVSAQPIRSPSTPMLSVDLSAQIKPWCQNVSIKLMVKQGLQPEVQET